MTILDNHTFALKNVMAGPGLRILVARTGLRGQAVMPYKVRSIHSSPRRKRYESSCVSQRHEVWHWRKCLPRLSV